MSTYGFAKTKESLRYQRFDSLEARQFHALSEAFKDLKSVFAKKYFSKDILAEGIMFYNATEQAADRPYMTKLRRNMFMWYWENLGIPVLGYPEEARA